ncbi:MAG: protein kinase [Chloroflexota bacterium]|nr:MAG: protein kinase [Chloroflexota bacterium]
MTQDNDNSLFGEIIDNFEIEEEIGQGGMGIVYRAYHPALQLYSAVKVMRSELASQSGFYERFLQEARTVARLEHPNIVDVINFGRYEDSYYLMMGYIDGPSLRHLIQENKGGLPVWDAVQIGWQVADVLVYSHAAGVLHRDLKPDNILLTHSFRPNRPYRVIVTDFGLVKLGQGSLLETQEGISLGTPAYMSPEQCRGDDLDGRTDIYALGVMLYEATTGKRPYPIRTIFEAARFHASGELVTPRSRNPAIPKKLDLLIRRMLAPNPGDRLASAAEAVDKLQELLDDLSEDESGRVRSALLRERILAESEATEPSAAESAMFTPSATPAAQEARQFFVQVAFLGVLEQRVHLLGAKPVIIGRLPSSDIVLDRPGQRYVSKRHCEVLVRDNRVLIRDLGSTNGTILGQESLETNTFREWSAEEQVHLGPFVLTLKTEQELASLPSPPVAGASETSSGLPTTRVHDAPRLSCANAVPSRLPLNPGTSIVIGRAVDSDMVIDHPHVSKHHCRVQLTGDGAEVIDLRSTNGTFLGDQRLAPHVGVPWRELSKLRVGPFEVTLERKST